MIGFQRVGKEYGVEFNFYYRGRNGKRYGITWLHIYIMIMLNNVFQNMVDNHA